MEMEGRPWQHFYSSPEQSLLESSAEPDVAQSLVEALALSVLKHLRAEELQDSSAASSVGERELLVDLVVAAGGKPLPIATSESPSPSPTPSPRRPRRTSSSSESDQASDLNGTRNEG